MIRDTNVGEIRNEDGIIAVAAHKETSIILHSYVLKAINKSWRYTEETNPNLNDGKRHRVRSFVIAHDDNPYPDTTKLKSLLNVPTTNHSNIKNSSDYGSKLGGFCPTCLANVKAECKKKFGGTW